MNAPICCGIIPALDRLYARLEAEYELKERAEVLERKFGALGDFTEVLLDIVQDKRAFASKLRSLHSSVLKSC